MTEVEFTKNDDGSYLFTAKGHSGFAEAGEDIICAAVSILSYTLGQMVSVMAADGGLEEEPLIEQDEDGATMTIYAKPKEGHYSAECMYAFHFAQVGFHLLKEWAPDYVRLKAFTVGDKAE